MGIPFGEWLESGRLSWSYKLIMLALLKAKWDNMNRFLAEKHRLTQIAVMKITFVKSAQ